MCLTFIRATHPSVAPCVAANLDHPADGQGAMVPVTLSAGALAGVGLTIALMVGIGGASRPLASAPFPQSG